MLRTNQSKEIGEVLTAGIVIIRNITTITMSKDNQDDGILIENCIRKFEFYRR